MPVHRWIVYPDNPELIIGLGPGQILILDWNLVEQRNYSVDWAQDTLAEGASLKDTHQIERALVNNYQSHILLQTSSRQHHSETSQFYMLNMSDLSCWDVTGNTGDRQNTRIRLNRLTRDSS